MKCYRETVNSILIFGNMIFSLAHDFSSGIEIKNIKVNKRVGSSALVKKLFWLIYDRN